MPNAPFLAPERDNAFKRGRPKISGGNTAYTIPGVVLFGASNGTVTASSGVDVYSPFFVDSPMLADRLACRVTTLAAGNMRMGIYAADTDWQPVGAPVADSGDISTGTTGIKTYTPGTAIYLPRGRYLTARNHNATPTLDMTPGGPPGAPGGANGGAPLGNPTDDLTVSRAYAAFPTPGTVWTTADEGNSVGFRYTILLRVSQP